MTAIFDKWLKGATPAKMARAAAAQAPSAGTPIILDLANMRETFGRSAPELLTTHFAHEIWQRYGAGELQPDSGLTGEFVFDETAADVEGVLAHIEDERLEAEDRQRRLAEAAAEG